MCFVATIRAKISCAYYLWKDKRDDLSMIPPMTVEQIWTDSFVRNKQLEASQRKELPALYWIGKPHP